jgi:phosphoglucomutase
MEILAVTGKNPSQLYESLTETYGKPVFGRIDAACSKEAKQKLKKLQPEDITVETLDGDAIINIRTTSLYKDMPIDGLRVQTEQGWFVARPSGTEDLYKIYGESYKGEKGLVALLSAGEELVSSVIKE